MSLLDVEPGISFTFVFPVMGRINALRVETVSNIWCWSEEVGRGQEQGKGLQAEGPAGTEE